MPADTLRTIVMGEGPPVVILHGYGLSPRSYRGLADLLAWRTRVAVPAIFALEGRRWSHKNCIDALEATLDSLGFDQVTLIGHSFGGGIELGFAARHPERVVELVFADTLGMCHEWTLAEEAANPRTLMLTMLRMATVSAAVDFTHSWLTHPVEMVRAAWWGFVSNRTREVATIAREGLPCHVLWASRDTLLRRADGAEFARDLHATFTAVGRPAGAHPVDHDWMYRYPGLFVLYLERLGLKALTGA
jgi:pimeloyl-ACP methyl ester carboxylesterase